MVCNYAIQSIVHLITALLHLSVHSDDIVLLRDAASSCDCQWRVSRVASMERREGGISRRPIWMFRWLDHLLLSLRRRPSPVSLAVNLCFELGGACWRRRGGEGRIRETKRCRSSVSGDSLDRFRRFQLESLSKQSTRILTVTLARHGGGCKSRCEALLTLLQGRWRGVSCLSRCLGCLVMVGGGGGLIEISEISVRATA